MLGNIILGSYFYGNNSSTFSLAETAYKFADPVGRIALHAQGVISILPGAPRLVELDVKINDDNLRTGTTPQNGVVIASYGQFDEFGTEAVSHLIIGSYGSFIANLLFFDGYSPIFLRSVGNFTIEQPSRNVVYWSNIGSLDFKINRTNVAGKTYLNHKGWIYQVKEFKDQIIAYGENGITLLTPHDKFYEVKDLTRFGIKSKHAVTGDKNSHWFINSVNELWQLSDSLTKLNYSEYLSVLTDPVMSYDSINQLIYICDGTYGFVYSVLDKSLGSGPINITGMSYQDSNLLLCGSSAIVIPTFEICTGIYDLGSRKNKTIHSIELGTDLTGNLQASIDFRSNHKTTFSNTGWAPVTQEGFCYIRSYGIEFRIRVKALTYEYFELDNIKINGVIHRYSPIDT